MSAVLVPTLRKELLLLRRDPRALVRLLVLPLLFIGIFGYVFKLSGDKQREARPISSLGAVLIMIMGLIGGSMFPRALMPPVMQQIGLFVPHGWALDGYYALLIGHGTGFADVLRPIGAVYGFALLFAVAGLRRFRFDP